MPVAALASESQVVGFAGVTGTVKCMDAPYPDYEKVIPDCCVSTFKLDKKPILESLDALVPIVSQHSVPRVL